MRVSHTEINKKVDKIEQINRKVHCRIPDAMKVNGRAYLLCGLQHQGYLQGFMPESFMKLEAKKQCRKCLQKLRERTGQ